MGYLHLFNNNEEIVFYPSSFCDVSDLIIFDRLYQFKKISKNPKIYIHNDACGIYHEAYVNGINSTIEARYPAVLNIIGSIRLNLNNGVVISLLKIENNNREIIWLLQFLNQDNEDFLKFIITQKWKIKYLYSICDGILFGMGSPKTRTRDKCIPVLLYSYFWELLGINFHILDFPIVELLNLKESWFDNLKEFVKELPFKFREGIITKMEMGRAEFCNQFNAESINDLYMGDYYPNFDVYMISEKQASNS